MRPATSVRHKPGNADLPVVVATRHRRHRIGVLSRGLLSGSKPKSPRDLRAHLPRFSEENLARNCSLVEALRRLATEKGATASQLAIAWVLAKGPDIVPLVGARTRMQLAESLGALQVTLTACATTDGVVPWRAKFLSGCRFFPTASPRLSVLRRFLRERAIRPWYSPCG